MANLQITDRPRTVWTPTYSVHNPFSPSFELWRIWLPERRTLQNARIRCCDRLWLILFFKVRLISAAKARAHFSNSASVFEIHSRRSFFRMNLSFLLLAYESHKKWATYFNGYEYTYKLKAAIFISPLLRRVRYNLATPLPPGIYIVFGKREVRGEPFRQYFPHQTATISLQNWGRSAIAIEITENKVVQLFFINAPVSVIKV